MHATRDGRTALLAYSALDRLHACCGRHHPWVAVRTVDLEHAHRARPFDLLLLDVALPGHARRSA
ncbi:MAG: SAV_915 family protein [Pseudonocardia sp.]